MPDLRIAGLEQHSSSAIQRDIQQGAVPLKVVPGHQQALSVWRPVGTHQSVPPVHQNLSRFRRGCGAKVDSSVVRTKNDYRSFGTIGGQAPIAIGIDLWGFCTPAAPHIEPICFRSISIPL